MFNSLPNFNQKTQKTAVDNQQFTNGSAPNFISR